MTATYFTQKVLKAAIAVAEQDLLAFPWWARKTTDGSLVAVVEDGNVRLYVNLAREGGGYEAAKRFAVRAGRQTEAGSPEYHGKVEYIL